MSWDYLVFLEKYFVLIAISVCQPRSSPPTFPSKATPVLMNLLLNSSRSAKTLIKQFSCGPCCCLCLIRSLCFPTELQHKNNDISSFFTTIGNLPAFHRTLRYDHNLINNLEPGQKGCLQKTGMQRKPSEVS